MELTVIFSDQFNITAVSNDGECDARDFLMDLPEQYQASSAGIFVLLQTVSSEGLAGLSDKQSHYVNKDEKIYEFIKGKLRLLYFIGKGNQLVICVCGYIKKTQKADSQMVNKAIRCRNEYFAAIASDTLIIIEDTIDEDE